MKNKAVILGSNYYIGLSIIRSLGKEGIYTVAFDYSSEGSYGAKSKYLGEQIICPHYDKEAEKLVEFLIDYAKEEEYKPVLYPTADPYAEFIDDNLERLKEHYHIWMTEPGLWTKIMDKQGIFELAIEHGMPVPETLKPADDDFIEQVERKLGFPCIIKPADSTAFVDKFKKKLFECHDMEELIERLSQVEEAGLEVVVQRIIPGFDDHMYTFDAYMDQDSEVTHWTTCQKHRQFPINYGASAYTEQRDVPELYDMSADFFRDIGYKGFGEIEYKKDSETGKYYMIEINARTTNFDALLTKIGINFPYVAYRDIIGDPLPKMDDALDTGVYFRYFQEDFLAIREYIRTGQLERGEIIRSLAFKKKAPAIWSWDDPKPGLSYSRDIFKKAVDRIFR